MNTRNGGVFIGQKAQLRLEAIKDPTKILRENKDLPEYGNAWEGKPYFTKSEKLKFVFRRPYTLVLDYDNGAKVEKILTNASKVLLEVAKCSGISVEWLKKRLDNINDLNQILGDAAAFMLIHLHNGHLFITNTGIDYIKTVMHLDDFESGTYFDWNEAILRKGTLNCVDGEEDEGEEYNPDIRRLQKRLVEARARREAALEELQDHETLADLKLARVLEIVKETKRNIDDERQELDAAYRQALNDEANIVREIRRCRKAEDGAVCNGVKNTFDDLYNMLEKVMHLLKD